MKRKWLWMKSYKWLTDWLIDWARVESAIKGNGSTLVKRQKQVSVENIGKDQCCFSWKILSFIFLRCSITDSFSIFFFFGSWALQALLLQRLWPFLSCLASRQFLSCQISIQVASINISTEFIFFNFLWPDLRICWLGDYWRLACPKTDHHIC